MLGRIRQPQEYRAPVLFLLGEGSSYMTGAVSGILQRHCMANTDLSYRIYELMEGITHGSARYEYQAYLA